MHIRNIYSIRPKKNISNSNSGYSGSTKSKSKSKDQMNYDIDGYYNDYKNSDGFVDEDDAWDDFEDNDAWEDY